MKIAQIEFLDIAENEEYINLIDYVIHECFSIEKLQDKNIYVSIILTTPDIIRKMNRKYRNMDHVTDVLSFPMFEKTEIDQIINKDFKNKNEHILGDIVINVEQVELQAEEYGHGFKRELSYMIVHGFYHLMGYDHMETKDQLEMRKKEEAILKELEINREQDYE